MCRVSLVDGIVTNPMTSSHKSWGFCTVLPMVYMTYYEKIQLAFKEFVSSNNKDCHL